jgi:hypothetical protein
MESTENPVILHSADNIEMVSFEQLIFGFLRYFGNCSTYLLFFLCGFAQHYLLYYVLYVILLGSCNSPWMVFYEFVTPNAGWFSNHSVLLIAIVAVLSGKYSEVFLNIKGINKTIYCLT